MPSMPPPGGVHPHLRPKMKIIYKYRLTTYGHNSISALALDADAKILTAAFQNEGQDLVIWAEVDLTPLKFRKYEFITYFTGSEFEWPSPRGFRYLSTQTDTQGLVYHIYWRQTPGYIQKPD